MVARLKITAAAKEQLHIDDLPRRTRGAFLLAATIPFFQNPEWYLAGGTALALHVGHRQSADLDFFTPQKTIDDAAIDQELTRASSEWKSNYRERGTIFGELTGTKVSLIAYPFFIPSPRRVRFGTIRLLVPEDIAVMKIIALSQRGRKRDFVDLYWYCVNREPLEKIIWRALLQYPGQNHNVPHILKSFTYFADAEDDPMPEIFFRANWASIKAYFLEEGKRLVKTFLEQ